MGTRPGPCGERDRPTDRPTGRVGGRETCVYRKRTFPLAMSIAYCQRRTRRTPPHAHEYCPGPTQLRLDSCSCAHPNEKVGRHPPTHPLLFVPPKLQCLHPTNFSPFLLSSPFLIWLSIRPSVRPSVGFRQHKPGQVLAVCLPLKDLTHSLTHSHQIAAASRSPLVAITFTSSPSASALFFHGADGRTRTGKRSPSFRGLGVTFSFIWVYKAAREGGS